MSLLRHIHACNTYRPDRFLPLFLGEARVGLVRRDNAEVLRRFPRTIEAGAESLRIIPRSEGAAITAALDEIVEVLVAEGLVAKWRDDVLFVYDLETPEDFKPRNTDGEIVEFMLMEAREVLARVRDTDDFKFNVNLILIDFAIRHGLATPEDPEYLALVAGLRAGGA